MPEIKLLYFCDEWKMRNSMRLQGVFDNQETLCDAIHECLKKGDIEKNCDDECKHCNHCRFDDLLQMSIKEINDNFQYLYVDVLELNKLK